MLMMQKMEMSIAMNITDETTIQSFVDDHHHTYTPYIHSKNNENIYINVLMTLVHFQVAYMNF